MTLNPQTAIGNDRQLAGGRQTQTNPRTEMTESGEEVWKKRKGAVLINNDYWEKAAAETFFGLVKIEVQNFSRGPYLTIKNWILQMETYFMAAKIAPETIVGLIHKIEPKHFDEIRTDTGLSYYQFRKKLFELFQQADNAQARMQELVRVRQNRDESITDFIN